VRAELEAEVARLEAELAAAKSKLAEFIEQVPAELHNLEASAWARIQAFFAKHFGAAPNDPPAA
jgi:hypothetical protein